MIEHRHEIKGRRGIWTNRLLHITTWCIMICSIPPGRLLKKALWSCRQKPGMKGVGRKAWADERFYFSGHSHRPWIVKKVMKGKGGETETERWWGIDAREREMIDSVRCAGGVAKTGFARENRRSRSQRRRWGRGSAHHCFSLDLTWLVIDRNSEVRRGDEFIS